MNNYLKLLLKKCKKDPYLFDKEFPTYLMKTLLEIPKVEGLFRTNSEFKMLLHFYGYTRSGCIVYYAQNSFRFLLDCERDTISEEIRREFDNSPIKETIFQGIAQAIDKKFLQINVMVEERFEKPGVPELNPPIEILVYIKFLDNTDYTLKIILNKTWNGKEYRYFHI
jgi:hypothetical protein